MDLNLYTDGSIVGGFWQSKNKPTTLPHIYTGWIVKSYLDMPIHWLSEDFGQNKKYSANVAEYLALRSALKWTYENFPLANLICHADSQLIINQMSDKYNCLDKMLLFLRDECRSIAINFPSVKYKWIRREENKDADFLSKALQSKYGGKAAESYQDIILGRINT